MEWVFLFAVVSGGVVTAVASHVSGRRERARAWQRALRDVGAQAIRLHARVGWPVRVEGRLGALTVRIRSFHNRETNRAGTRIEIHGLTSAIALKASQDRGDIRIGDEAFDSLIHVSGNEPVAAALLDARTRTMVCDLFAQRVGARRRELLIDMGARLDHGRLIAERSLGDQPVWLAGYLRELVGLAGRLQQPADAPERMLANLREDPHPEVRHTNLELLLQLPAGAAARQAAIAAGLVDFNDRVKLEAALAAGGEGRPALLEIATREDAEDACAAHAIAALRTDLPAGQARAVLARAIDASRMQTAAACLDSLGQRGPEEAEVIGGILSAAAGPLAVAAARALASVGTASSIVLLRESEARQPLYRDLRQAVAESTAAIRARLVGAEAGQVTLAAEKPGRVTLVTDEAGRVSVPSAADGPE